MKLNRIFFAQLFLVALIAVAHSTVLHFGLYWRWPWVDLPLHFFGGLWVAFFFLWVTSHNAFQRYAKWEYILLGVIMIGAGWEIFEVIIDPIRESNYMFDTSVDMMMDVIGGVIAYMLKSWMLHEKT